VIRLVAAAMLAILLMQLTSCAGETVGVSAAYSDPYWDGPVYGYDLDYFYGPPVIYGGWGPGYFVGPPPRWGAAGPPRPVPRPIGGRPPGFRPAAPGRPMPSIPSGPRGGGMRGGAVRP
jgi:hypothetical protein